MRYVVAFALLIAFQDIIAQDDLSLFQKREYVSREGKVLPYRILYPKSYNPSVKYPCVLFLHGAGERGKDNESQLKNGVRLFLQEDIRKKYPCFVIIPQCPLEDFWSSVKIDTKTSPATFEFDYSAPEKESLSSAMAVLKRAMTEESIEKNRVYITGLSMGGMGTFEAVYRYPEIFAAAMPVCGGGDSKSYDKNLKDISFWIFHGDQDPAVPVKYSQEMVQRLKQLKIDVKYSEYPGVKHNSWDNAFMEPDFIAWMFSHKRKTKS